MELLWAVSFSLLCFSMNFALQWSLYAECVKNVSQAHVWVDDIAVT